MKLLCLTENYNLLSVNHNTRRWSPSKHHRTYVWGGKRRQNAVLATVARVELGTSRMRSCANSILPEMDGWFDCFRRFPSSVQVDARIYVRQVRASSYCCQCCKASHNWNEDRLSEKLLETWKCLTPNSSKCNYRLCHDTTGVPVHATKA
jgi:hypothetical protein